MEEEQGEEVLADLITMEEVGSEVLADLITMEEQGSEVLADLITMEEEQASKVPLECTCICPPEDEEHEYQCVLNEEEYEDEMRILLLDYLVSTTTNAEGLFAHKLLNDFDSAVKDLKKNKKPRSRTNLKHFEDTIQALKEGTDLPSFQDEVYKKKLDAEEQEFDQFEGKIKSFFEKKSAPPTAVVKDQPAPATPKRKDLLGEQTEDIIARLSAAISRRDENIRAIERAQDRRELDEAFGRKIHATPTVPKSSHAERSEFLTPPIPKKRERLSSVGSHSARSVLGRRFSLDSSGKRECSQANTSPMTSGRRRLVSYPDDRIRRQLIFDDVNENVKSAKVARKSPTRGQPRIPVAPRIRPPSASATSRIGIRPPCASATSRIGIRPPNVRIGVRPPSALTTSRKVVRPPSALTTSRIGVRPPNALTTSRIGVRPPSALTTSKIGLRPPSPSTASRIRPSSASTSGIRLSIASTSGIRPSGASTSGMRSLGASTSGICSPRPSTPSGLRPPSASTMSGIRPPRPSTPSGLRPPRASTPCGTRPPRPSTPSGIRPTSASTLSGLRPPSTPSRLRPPGSPSTSPSASSCSGIRSPGSFLRPPSRGAHR